MIVLIACGFATARFGSGLQMPATTTRDGTLITLSRYLREPVPDIVLVGSSITWRLKEEYFATPDSTKFGACRAARRSPVWRSLPTSRAFRRIVLVEANVLVPSHR